MYFPLRASTPVPIEGTSPSEAAMSFSSSSPDNDSSTCQDITEQSFDGKDITDLSFNLSEQSSSTDESLNETAISIEPEATETCTMVKSTNAGYKLVFDNIDKTIKPRFMTQDSQTTTLHYVQAYAVKDRIDYSSIGPERKNESNLYAILPDSEDYRSLKERFATHVSRVITTNLDFFREDLKGLTQRHIPHRYSTEMCHKSEIVSNYL